MPSNPSDIPTNGDRRRAFGVYCCAACRTPLFDHAAKLPNGDGFPAFSRPRSDAPVAERTTTAFGMVQTSVRCCCCNAELGYVFPDGPLPGGMRYRISPSKLEFEPATERAEPHEHGPSGGHVGEPHRHARDGRAALD